MNETDIKDFFNTINTKVKFIEQVDQLYSSKLALKFNSLHFLSWNENKVSEILAFFLDPHADHQQGDIFLKLFLDYFDVHFPYSDVSKVRVKLEETTLDNRRVDIVISYRGNEQLLGIENKIYPWTKDQDGQVKDYLHYLESMSTSGNYQLFYLAPKSKKLSEYSVGSECQDYLESKKLLIINYEDHIIPLLKQFAMYAGNERVRNFITDFELRLREEYLGIDNLTDTNMITNYIKENTGNLKTAFSIYNNLNQVKLDLREELQRQMKELADELNLEFNDQNNHFVLIELRDTYVKYNYEMGGIIYGIVKRPGFYDKNPDKLSCNKLKEYLQVKFNTSQWWPLYTLKYPRIEVEEELWIDIIDGRFKEFMKEFILKVQSAPADILREIESR
jgi:hypothetical protein